MQMPEAPRRALVSMAAPRPAPRYVQLPHNRQRDKLKIAWPRRGIVAFPSRLYDISHKTDGEEHAQWPRKMAHILFYKFYLSGCPCVFWQGSHLSPKRDPCREGTFLAQARAWIASQSAFTETLVTSSSWTARPTAAKTHNRIPSRLARELRLSSSRYNRHPHHA